MNPVSQITGEGRAEFVWTWGADFDKKNRGEGGGQLNLCLGTKNPSRG